MNKRQILFFSDKKTIGSPVEQRLSSFINFYENNGYKCLRLDPPKSFRDKLKFINQLYWHRYRCIFISMPPFRNWYLFLLPKQSIIIDFRDGWSIAMRTGYGGISKKKYLKFFIAKIMELYSIVISKYMITCTTGLYNYHTRILPNRFKSKCLFVPNGFNQELKVHRINRNDNYRALFVCAGKFSEYGKSHVKNILKKINQLKISKIKIIKIIGASIKKNIWVIDYIKKQKFNMGIEFMPRVSTEELNLILEGAEYGIAIIRDPQYDYGTKIYDYIYHGLKIITNCDKNSNFYKYFRHYFEEGCMQRYSRINGILRNKNKLLDI